MVEESLIDRRRSGQHRDPVLLHGAHGPLGVECELRDEGGTGLQTGQDARLIAEVVEERVDAEVPVGAGELPARSPRCGCCQRLPVCAQHTFAAAGGTGCEQNIGNIVGPDRCRAGVELRKRDLGPGDELVPGSPPAAVVLHRDADHMS